jgi:phenylalanine-4-hydroxylase
MSLIMTEKELADRRKQVIGLVQGADSKPATITYLPHENHVWHTVSTALRPLWDKHVAYDILEAREVIRLPINFVPQLSDVTASLSTTSGFEFRGVGGLVQVEEFFSALGKKKFLFTQYLRHPKSPLYTPEPDIIHEVIGHGTCLANPALAELHQLAGEALVRLRSDRARKAIADVFWFSGEFGVLREVGGLKAFGAGLLSSVGELEWFSRHATVHDIDIAKMASMPYRIDQFQENLFAAESMAHLMQTVGEFFKTATDESIQELLYMRPR